MFQIILNKAKKFVNSIKYHILFVLAYMALISVTVSAQGAGDLNLLPAYKDLFDFMLNGIINGFLVRLAPIVGVLAIVWGGYKYFFGSFSGKEDGLNAIRAGVTGLAIITGYQIFIQLGSGGEIQGGLIADIFKGGGINADPINKFIQDVLLNNFLYALAGVVAVLAMVYGGYQYVTSPFNKETGIKTIQNAVIGLVVILLAAVAKNFITATFKDNTISKDPFIELSKQVVSNFLLPVSSIVTLFFVVYGSYQWITAQEPSQVKEAQKTLKNALIGLAIVLASFSITQLLIYIISNLNLAK